jgi:hypothetical protein
MTEPGEGPDRSSRGAEGDRPRFVLDHVDPALILIDLSIVILIVSLVLALAQAIFGAPPSS